MAASRLAKHRGEDDLADQWLERAGELHAATMHYMADEEHGFIDYGEEGPAAGRAWAAWPTHFLPYDDERLIDLTEQVLDFNHRRVMGKEGNGGYPTKVAIGAAIALSDDASREKAIEIARRLAGEIAVKDTWTIGESIVPVDEDGDGETDDFINGVSTPHLWSSILVYVTAVAYHQPERFDPYMDVLPEVTVPEVVPPGVDPGAGDGDAGGGDVADGGGEVGTAEPYPPLAEPTLDETEGCSCSSTSRTPPIDAGLTVLCLLSLVAGWRRRPR